MRFFQSFLWQRCDSREWKNSWAKVLRTEESSWKSGPAIWRKAADGEVTTPKSWTTNIAWKKSTKWMSRLVIFQAMLAFQALILVGYLVRLSNMSQKDMLQQEGWFKWFHQLFRIYCIEEIYQLKWTPCVFFGVWKINFQWTPMFKPMSKVRFL